MESLTLHKANSLNGTKTAIELLSIVLVPAGGVSTNTMIAMVIETTPEEDIEISVLDLILWIITILILTFIVVKMGLD